MSKTFRARYWLESLQTRSSPLFSTVRAYLANESLKRLIGESTPIKNGKLLFQAQIEEEARSIALDNKGKYAQAKTTIILQFGAQGRFIKMGEVQVSLSDILHLNKNGEVLPYRVQKCYDRNAKVNLGVSLTQSGKGERSQVDLHSRSQCQFPTPKVKMRTSSNKNKFVMATEYEQFTDREEKEEDLSMISDRHHSIVRTLNRTELLMRKPNTQSQEVLDLKTENRIYQHQIVQLEQHLKQAEEEIEELNMEKQGFRAQVTSLEAAYEEINAQLKEREHSKEIQREQLTIEVAKIRKLYQESEQERNKLLFLREEETSKEKERLKEHEKKAVEDRNKIRQLQRNEDLLKKKIEQCMQQIAMYDKNLKNQQKNKQKMHQAMTLQQKTHSAIISQLQLAKQTCLRLTESNSEMQSELQISRFSLNQLEKELTLIKRTLKETQSKLMHCEAELKLSTQTMQTQRSNFTRRINEIQAQNERDQLNMEAYLQELQIKTSKEQNKNGLINTLRREVSRLRQQLANEGERAGQMEIEIQGLSSSNKLMEDRIQDYQSKIMSLSRQNALLQGQLASRRQLEEETPRLSEQGGISEQEKQALISQCYEERDEVWRKELESLENDTRALIEKTKREKDEHVREAKRLKEDLHACEESLKKSKMKIKDLQQDQEKWKRTIKQLQGKCHQFEKSSNQLRMECNKYEKKIDQMQKKVEQIPQLQESLRESQKKIAAIKHEAQHLRSDLEKQKTLRTKIRSDTKEIITTAATYLGKSQKHRVFYDELHCQYIDAQLLLVFNSSCKLYCDRHNRLRGKLQQLQELKGKLESKQRECEKLNSSNKDERRSQGGSCDSASSANNRSQSQTTMYRQLHTVTHPKTPQKDDLQVRALKRQLQQLKNKIRKDGTRNSELERQLDKMKRTLEEAFEDARKCKDQSDAKNEEIGQLRERLKGKEKQLEMAYDELKGLTNQINYLKSDLQQATRALKQEKGQNFQNLKRSVVNRSFHVSRTDRQDETLKLYDLEKKLRQTQDELDRVKRQRDDRKNENSHQRLTKGFETRLKEKDEAIAALKESLEQQRQKVEQTKQLYNLKLRKQKQEYQEELQSKTKQQKETAQTLSDCEQKLRQAQKKLKITQQALRNATNQLQTSTQREEKTKKLLTAEWQLKLKASQGQYQTQINHLNKRIDELRVAQRVAKESQRRKDKELSDARQEVERGERTVAELTERLQLCGQRLKNMEQEENNYKEVIGALQNKIKVQSEESRRERDADRDTLDNHSTFSLKTFTFR